MAEVFSADGPNSPTTRLVLAALGQHMNADGSSCFPSTRTLAIETGLSERSVCTHLDLADKTGWIEVRQRAGTGQKWRSHQYFPSIPGTEEGSAPSTVKGAERGSAPSEGKVLNLVHEGAEPDSRKALNDVQSTRPVTRPKTRERGKDPVRVLIDPKAIPVVEGAKKKLADLESKTKGVTAAQKASDKEAAAYTARLAKLLGELDPVALKTQEYMQAVEDLDKAWVDGLLSGDEYDRKIMELATDKEALKKQTEDLTKAEEDAAKERAELAKKNQELLLEPFKNAIEGVQGVITDGLEDVFDGTIDDAGDAADAIKRIFFRMAAEIATLKLFNPQMSFGSIIGATGLLGSGTASAATTLAQPGGISLNPLSFLGGNSIGMGFQGAGDWLFSNTSLPTGNLMQAGQYANWQYGAAGLLGGVGANWLYDGKGMSGLGGSAGATIGMAFGGPLGALAGAVIGGGLGSFIGNSEPTNASAFGIVDVTGGRQLQAPAEANSTDATRAARDALVTSVLSLRQVLVEAGASVRGQVHLDVGQRDGIQVAGLGAGQYMDPQVAIAAIFEDMVDRAKGLGAEWRRVFDRLDLTDLEGSIQDIADAAFIINKEYKIAEPLNAAAQAIKNIKDNFDPIIAKARELGLAVAPIRAEQNRQLRALRVDFNAEIRDSILAITDPLQAALNAFDDVAAERLANARELGANITRVERLNALERQQIIEQFADQSVTALTAANQNIQQYLRSITSGSGSFLSPAATLANAEAEFSRLLGLARGGDTQARADIVGAAQDLRAISRETFGSTEMFFERDQFIRQTLGNLIGQTSSGATFDNIGVTIAEGNAQNDYWNRAIVGRLDQLTQVVADQQAVLERLAAR